MTLASQKKLWWMVLPGSFGSLAFFAVLFAIKGPLSKREMIFYLWPVISIAAFVVSIVRLYSIYRREPDGFSGLWQLTITDFYCDICFTALSMAVARAMAPNDFVPVGIVLAVLLGVAYLVSMLVAARKGFRRSLVKWIYALGMLLRSLGFMAAVVVLIVVPLIMIGGGGPGEVSQFMSQIAWPKYRNWPTDVIRIAMICLPVGIGICKFVESALTGAWPRRPKSQPEEK
jgi:hypothetical protein